jgi:hypothetical protein
MSSGMDPVQGRAPIAVFRALQAMKAHARWGEVQEMLSDGIPAYVIAQETVAEWSGLTLTDEVVERAILLYAEQEAARSSGTVAGARQVFTDAPPDAPPPATPSPGGKAALPAAPPPAPEAAPEIDPLDALNWLWAKQRKRIERAADIEESVHAIFPTTHKEVATGMRLLESIAELRMDRGIDRRNLGHLEVDNTNLNIDVVRRTHGDTVASIHASPKSRQRVLSFVDRLDAILARTVGEMPRKDAIDITPPKDE